MFPFKKDMHKISGFAMSVPFFWVGGGEGGLSIKILPLGVGDDIGKI